ncbi:MAG TPA: glucosamine-6-phosphate deaminase [Planctomycetota bacterium]|nr:glucosamine-6-phosphate deaminase [Planctomycetota bacterium]
MDFPQEVLSPLRVRCHARSTWGTHMELFIHSDPSALGRAAGTESGDLIAATLRSQGQARIVLATGASQFATLDTLVARTDIDWSRVDCFHLDEYVGLPATHPASFRCYLRERFLAHVGALRSFHAIVGETNDPARECARLGALIRTEPIDVLLLGIGENAHLAFNDPPADCTTTEPYLVVDLDERCRRQQVGESWFADLAAVPRQAISMSVRHMLSARTVVGSVPDARKAAALHASIESPLTPLAPGSYLRQHPHCSLHVDAAAAALLARATRANGKPQG